MPIREAVEDVVEAGLESSPEAPDALEAEPNLVVIAATERLVPTASLPQSQIWLISAWVMTFIFLGAAVAATVVWRADIARAWPPNALILTPGGQKPATFEQNMGKKSE